MADQKRIKKDQILVLVFVCSAYVLGTSTGAILMVNYYNGLQVKAEIRGGCCSGLDCEHTFYDWKADECVELYGSTRVVTPACVVRGTCPNQSIQGGMLFT